jgi:hypothetical protein
MVTVPLTEDLLPMPPPLVAPNTATAAQSSGGGDPTEEDAVTLIDLDHCVVTPAPVRTEAEYRACVAAYDADLVQRLGPGATTYAFPNVYISGYRSPVAAALHAAFAWMSHDWD